LVVSRIKYSFIKVLLGFILGGTGLTLKLKVGKKGYIILPKAVREAVGLKEGDEVIVEIRDGILLKPVRKVDIDKLKEFLEEHVEKLKDLKSSEPRPGELAGVYMEEEFEN